jgi:hypothetical protein
MVGPDGNAPSPLAYRASALLLSYEPMLRGPLPLSSVAFGRELSSTVSTAGLWPAWFAAVELNAGQKPALLSRKRARHHARKIRLRSSSYGETPLGAAKVVPLPGIAPGTRPSHGRMMALSLQGEKRSARTRRTPADDFRMRRQSSSGTDSTSRTSASGSRSSFCMISNTRSLQPARQ